MVMRGGNAIHRGPSQWISLAVLGRYREGYGRFPAELRRLPTRAVSSAGEISEPAGNGAGYRRRYGDEHPPAQSGEIVDACMALIDNPALGIDDLINIVPGPDFPTGGVILGRQGIRAAYHLGRGSIVMRGPRRAPRTMRKVARGADRHRRNSRPGEQGARWSSAWPNWCAEKKLEGIGDHARRIAT